MRIAGRGSRTIGRWSVVAALVLVLGATEDQLRCSPCDVAFDGRAWNRVVAACRDPRWGGRERLGRAWLAWEEQGPDEALAMAERLLDTDVAADAAYLVGYILFNRESFNEDRVRQLLYQALAEYRRTGRHADASRAAGLLARVPRPETRFDDQLTLSQQAVDEAEQSDDAGALGRALGTLAESYDVIGMEDAARTNFLDAERLTAPWPDERAHIYFKHAVFLLDLGTPQGLEASLSLFGRAAKECAKAVTKDLAKRVESLALAIRLNRADALSQLDRLGDADRELEAAGHDLGASPDVDELARIRLVRGYVAARRHDLGTAEALFRQVDGGALGGDYRARIALELARTYRNSRHLDQAESRYRNAIDIIEEVRKQTNKVELRPWVLARRTLPYVELLELLVAQDRAVDALVIAESLHARAWQDVVLGQRTDDRAATAQALTAARIRQSLHAAPTRPLDAAALMATIGDREALVFFAIGPATWRVHVVHGLVHFERLPDDAVEVANRFLLDPDDPAAVERASGVLLPADLAVSESPLYVVANGALAEVPFAALRARGRYLIEDRPVARLPGLVALRCIASVWESRTVVIGDSRGDLPDAAREVQQIAAATGAVPGVGSAASWSALVSARGAQLLHIAAHGVPNSVGTTAIALSDGDLTAADVLDLDLGPEVVVLTGCATAASDDAESWNGFPSAFLAAGSRYVIATLRSVEDPEAAQVARAYYAQPASMSPIERLAAAQRTLVDVLSVKAWSSFAAWGSDACDASVRHNPTVGTK